MDVLPPLLGWCSFILLLEGMLWILFKRKFIQICLPTQGEEVFFHFFTVGRLRLLAIIHTLILLACVIIGHLLLWP
ncbi:MAG: hypothetical protein PHX87_03275 [Candidatus Peribacteraceae bacterium]|nr:hypothetical protein [Candidatus Peribacteraceae bacterium]MDD5742429.1 hypothetical protein [Candidatus Peribacteraceae bacterium]